MKHCHKAIVIHEGDGISYEQAYQNAEKSIKNVKKALEQENRRPIPRPRKGQ